MDNSLSQDTKEALIALWMEGFGDEREDVEVFFNTAFSDGAVAIVKKDDELAAAMYLLEGQRAVRECDGKEYRLTYLYALSAFKKFRGLGLGSEAFLEARKLAFERGADIVALCPADANLIKFYDKLGMDRMCIGKGLYEETTDKESVFTVKFSKEYLELREKYRVYDEYAAINEEDRVVMYKLKDGVECEKLYFSPILF